MGGGGGGGGGCLLSTANTIYIGRKRRNIPKKKSNISSVACLFIYSLIYIPFLSVPEGVLWEVKRRFTFFFNEIYERDKKKI